MAKLNFDDGAVWDNTLSTDKYSTKMPGHGSKAALSQVQVLGGRLRGLETQGKPLVVVTGTFDFDASYPTGGEDVSELVAMFPNAVSGVLFEHPNVAAVKTVKFVTNKILAYTDAFTTQATGNLSAVTGIRFIAWGY